MNKEKIIVVSGEFDPLTQKDINFLLQCKQKGDWLIVGVHTDWWMHYTRGGIRQDYKTRREIISNLKMVDEVFAFNDMDGTVCELLKRVKICYDTADITYISEDDMFNMPETRIRGINFETIK